MALTELQKLAAQAIVQIFETGSVKGDYGQVTLIVGDSGHLTYGKAQTTLASGNLFFLIRDYCDAPDADLAEDLKPYLPQLEARDVTLDKHFDFKGLLKLAGDDPVMRKVQDAFFDRVYWEPALASAAYIGAKLPLSIAIIYDSRIHGAWHARRDAMNAKTGDLKKVGEKKWMKAYLKHRRDWLANNPNPALQRTVYRMDALGLLVSDNRWTLKLPFDVRNRTISKDTLTKPETPSPRAPDPAFDHRLLRLTDPFMEGDDVRELQLALSAANQSLTVDGFFGPGTHDAVVKFQTEQSLVTDGIVGNLTREKLGLNH